MRFGESYAASHQSVFLAHRLLSRFERQFEAGERYAAEDKNTRFGRLRTVYEVSAKDVNPSENKNRPEQEAVNFIYKLTTIYNY